MLAIYEHLRRDDIFATYAIVPPPGARNPDFYEQRGLDIPALRATEKTEHGVILNGMKMLATGAAIANEVTIGNILPLAPDRLAESITCVIPFNLPGLTLWSRPPMALRRRGSEPGPVAFTTSRSRAASRRPFRARARSRTAATSCWPSTTRACV